MPPELVKVLLLTLRDAGSDLIFSITYGWNLTLQPQESTVSFSLPPLSHFSINIDDYRTIALEFKIEDLCCQIENDNTKERS